MKKGKKAALILGVFLFSTFLFYYVQAAYGLSYGCYQDLDGDSDGNPLVPGTFIDNAGCASGYVLDKSPDDCDDNPADDNKIDVNILDYPCPADQSNIDCGRDLNNNGIHDYAACAKCRYGSDRSGKSAPEDCDNIDNNCDGSYIANDGANIVKCNLLEGSYKGDGADKDSFLSNIYGVVDNFCQMVDEPDTKNAYRGLGNQCKSFESYNRCVNTLDYRTNIIPPRELGKSDRNGKLENIGVYNAYMYEYDLYVFKPGGYGLSENNDADCGVYHVIEKILCFPPTDTLDVNNLDNYGCSRVITLSKKSLYPNANCLPSQENKAKSRGTVGALFPEQMIDSMRGELNYPKFLEIASKVDGAKVTLRSETANGVTKQVEFFSADAKWNINDCVRKDKCDDRVDNNGAENLSQLQPYSYFLYNVSEKIALQSFNGEVRETAKVFEMPIKLIDADDPACKFINPKANYASIETGLPTYPDLAYRTNPVKNKPYCYDQDKDGFCGCPSELSSGKVGVIDTVFCDQNLKSNYMYTISKQFPDCEDNPNKKYISAGTATLKTIPKFGWSGALAGKEFNSWNIHPFSPVNIYTCNIGKYDFNCNKAGFPGYDYSLFYQHSTPFDWDIATGKEIKGGDEYLSPDTITYWFDWASSLKKDQVCYESNAYINTIRANSDKVGMWGLWLQMMAIDPKYGGMAAPIAQPLANIFFLFSSAGYVVTSPQQFVEAYINNDVAGMAEGGVMGILSVLNLGAITKTAIRENRAAVAVYKQTQQIVAKVKKSIPAEEGVIPESSKAPVTSGGCFLENTTIILADGSIRDIQDIQVGEEVIAYDLENKKAVNVSVTATFVRNETKYRIITYEVIE